MTRLPLATLALLVGLSTHPAQAQTPSDEEHPQTQAAGIAAQAGDDAEADGVAGSSAGTSPDPSSPAPASTLPAAGAQARLVDVAPSAPAPRPSCCGARIRRGFPAALRTAGLVVVVWVVVAFVGMGLSGGSI